MSVTPTAADGDRSAYEPLLRQVAVLYERYEARRKEPFNLFTVLRKASDEEHLHSKFLEALLNRESNLEDFVQKVVAPAVDAERQAAEREEPEPTEQQAEDGEPIRHRDSAAPVAQSSKTTNGAERMLGFSFSIDGARIEREQDHIDLLIRNAKGKAIVIENKIWAGDQQRQLQRYFDTVTRRGLEPTLVYLTLDGHEPSDDSRGTHEVLSLSYGRDLVPWLRRCQERACAEPALRESVAQYIALIRTLCGDSGREFMTELKKFLSEGNNLVLAGRLGRAAADAWLDLLLDYWKRVREEVESEIDVRDQRNLRDWLNRFLFNQGRRKGLSQHHFHYAWGLGDRTHAWLSIEAKRDQGIFYGVICHREKYLEEYERLKSKLSSSGYGEPDPWWPGRKFIYRGSVVRPSEGAISVLRDETKRSDVAQDLIRTWKTLQEP